MYANVAGLFEEINKTIKNAYGVGVDFLLCVASHLEGVFGLQRECIRRACLYTMCERVMLPAMV